MEDKNNKNSKNNMKTKIPELSLTIYPSTRGLVRCIQDARNHRIPKAGNVQASFSLTIIGVDMEGVHHWCPDEHDKKAILHLMEELPCTRIMLSNFCSEMMYPEVKEIIVKASQSWQELGLCGRFSDTAFQFIHGLVRAKGGTQNLKLINIQLSMESLTLLSSDKFGTGDEHSNLYVIPRNMPEDTFAQILQGISGFRELCIVIHHSYPETFRALGQFLSSTNCELSKLELIVTWSYAHATRVDFINLMLEAITTNSSLRDLRVSSSDQIALTQRELSSLGQNLHKFHQLKRLEVTISRESTSLEFLRPLLDCSSNLNRSLAALEIQFILGWNGTEFLPKKSYEQISDADDNLLRMLAQTYPNLSSFGPRIELSPTVKYILAMNGRWRQFVTRDPELPLSLWHFVLADVEKHHKSDQEAMIASIRYKMIKYLISYHFVGLVATECSFRAANTTRTNVHF